MFATPKTFEVWFLSPASHAFIKLPPEYRHSSQLIADNKFTLQCEKYGDYCFDPQVGLYKPDAENDYIEVGQVDLNKKMKAEDESRKKGVFDSSMISCDKKNFFDLYCGKEKSMAKIKTNLEIWVDTSSSLRAIDPIVGNGCSRKSLVVNLQKDCYTHGLDIYTFNTSKRYTTAIDNLCLSYGLNDTKRLIRWIKDSEAKHLVIITDIGEFTSELSDFIDANNGFIHGAELGDVITPKNIKKLTNSVVKHCQKK